MWNIRCTSEKPLADAVQNGRKAQFVLYLENRKQTEKAGLVSHVSSISFLK